mmetsp:Transcript_21116/g.39595  ORF Transcript_21116/g.39595 Transcript_21116/m.39595 type:complete len:215 (+) Transcript_21116:463-1107(+)
MRNSWCSALSLRVSELRMTWCKYSLKSLRPLVSTTAPTDHTRDLMKMASRHFSISFPKPSPLVAVSRKHSIKRIRDMQHSISVTGVGILQNFSTKKSAGGKSQSKRDEMKGRRGSQPSGTELQGPSLAARPLSQTLRSTCQPRLRVSVKIIPRRETVAGEASWRSSASNIIVMVSDILIISPLMRQSFLLSSRTVFMFSIQMASTGPSATIHML